MLTTPRDESTVTRLCELLPQLLKARDELYAAVDLIRDPEIQAICRWMGDRHGGHAAVVEQIIAASCGSANVTEPDYSATDVDSMLAKMGPPNLLWAIERCEHDVTERYDEAIREIKDLDVRDLLVRQRDDSVFADCVLRNLRTPT